jgi:hypothetical protein
MVKARYEPSAFGLEFASIIHRLEYIGKLAAATKELTISYHAQNDEWVIESNEDTMPKLVDYLKLLGFKEKSSGKV